MEGEDNHDNVGKGGLAENNENIYEEIKVGKNDSSSSRLRRIFERVTKNERRFQVCLLYTSDAADE